MDVAGEMARRIADKDADAVRIAKEAVIRGMDLPLHEGLEMEEKLVNRLFSVMRLKG